MGWEPDLAQGTNQTPVNPTNWHTLVDRINLIGNTVYDDEAITADAQTLAPYGSSALDSTSNKVDSTLGSGPYIGVIKTIIMTEASNSSTVTVTNHVVSDPEIGTFNAVDQTWVLQWTGTEWITLYATCLGVAFAVPDVNISSLTASRLVSSDGSKNLVSSDADAWVAGTANQVIVSDDADGSLTLSTPQDIHTGASPTFSGIAISGLATSRLVSTDGSKNLESSDATAWIAGTANQITVADDADGTVTLSTPQDIHTSASPTFAGITLNGEAAIGVGTKHDGYMVRDAAEVQTVNANQTTLDSFTLLDENTYHVEAWVIGVEDDGSNRASYHIAATIYRTSAGGATIQGAVTSLHTQESEGAWDATFTVNGNDVRVSVTGEAATTIEWGCTLKSINMSN